MQTLHCLQSTNLPSLFDLLDDCLEPFVRVIAKIIPTAKIADIAIKRMPFLLVELTGMAWYLWVKSDRLTTDRVTSTCVPLYLQYFTGYSIYWPATDSPVGTWLGTGYRWKILEFQLLVTDLPDSWLPRKRTNKFIIAFAISILKTLVMDSGIGRLLRTGSYQEIIKVKEWISHIGPPTKVIPLKQEIIKILTLIHDNLLLLSHF